MTLAVVLIVLVSLALVVAVAGPLLGRTEERAPVDPSEDELREVQAALARSLSAIREIEFDHQAGNITDEDFGALDADERARAVELIRQRDGLAGKTEGA